jgi:hypothetical protein
MNHIQKKTQTEDKLLLSDLKFARFMWEFAFATSILVLGSFLGIL